MAALRVLDDVLVTLSPRNWAVENYLRAAWNFMMTVTVPPSIASLLVVYASQTGNAESIAKHIHEEALVRGFASACFVANDAEKVPWADNNVVVFVTSTTGDGDHPDNASKFWKWLRRGKAPADPAVVLKGKPYTILGLGDTNYTNFCQPAKRLDRRLIELGAKSVLAKALADDATGLEATVDPWVAKLWTTLEQLVVRDGQRAAAFAAKGPAGDQVNVGLALPADQGPASAHASPPETPITPRAAAAAAPAAPASAKPKAASSAAPAPYADCYAARPVVVSGQDVLAVSAQLSGLPKSPLEFLDVAATGDRRPAASIFDLLPAAPSPRTSPSLESVQSLPASVATASTATISAAKSRFSANAPFAARVLSARCISGLRAVDRVLEIELDIAGCAWDYVPGDAFGVLAPNPAELVAALADRLGLGKGDAVVEISSKQALGASGLPFATAINPTYADVLSHFLELRALPKKAFFRKLAEHTADAAEKKQLLFLASTQGAAAFKDLRDQCPTLLDILAAFPSCTPPFAALIENLGRLQPRFYSVASTADANPGRVRFAFNVVSYSISPNGAAPRPMRGLCSSWLDALVGNPVSPDPVDLSAAGITIPFFPRASAGFHMPRELSHTPTPLVLVAAGTGISPFVSFLEAIERERHANPAAPARSVWLVHGHRFAGADGDALYADAIARHVESGVVTRYIECLSREPAKAGVPKYVQDGIAASAEQIWDLFDVAEASIYVCGSLAMGKSVNEALAKLVTDHWNISHVEAITFLNGKTHEKKYLRDLWG